MTGRALRRSTRRGGLTVGHTLSKGNRLVRLRSNAGASRVTLRDGGDGDIAHRREDRSTQSLEQSATPQQCFEINRVSLLSRRNAEPPDCNGSQSQCHSSTLLTCDGLLTFDVDGRRAWREVHQVRDGKNLGSR